MAIRASLHVDTRAPGLETKITQTFDLSRMTKLQRSNLLRAIKLGVAPPSGGLSALMEAMADYIGVPHLVSIARHNWDGSTTVAGTSKNLAGDAFDELMRVSDVKYALMQGSHPKEFRPDRVRHSRWERGYNHSSYLVLEGYLKTDIPALKKTVSSILSTIPAYASAREKLAEFVATNPKFVCYNKTI